MDSLDLNRLIERAQRGESVFEKVAADEPIEGVEVADLMQRVDNLVEQDELDTQLEKKAADERVRHITMAKMLAAVDVFTEVGR